MNILVVGSGGREHALCWAITRSPRCAKLYCAPGNAGIADVGECVDIAADDIDALVSFARSHKIDLVVIGPEDPLVLGLADRLEALGIAAFGPSAAAARLEGSKAFMKDFLSKYEIPTARYDRFDEPDEAKEYIMRHGAPIVIKTDGLAAGKGVILCHNVNEAYAAIDHMMTERVFGAAGDTVLIEEFLEGEEASFFALVDGVHAVPLASAQDHKAAFDGDTGPNTGGMGAYSPAPVVDAAMQQRIMDTIITPAVQGMAKEGHPFKGVLFAGIMITEDGPKLLEFNVRFGDPECQVLMARLHSDALDMLEACAKGTLDKVLLRWREESALVVVMATKGYPGRYEKGGEIKDLKAAAHHPGVVVFHAGTKLDGDRVLVNGGRVLGVTALGKTVKEAQVRAYEAVDSIDWPEGFCRRDIGWRAIAREANVRKTKSAAKTTVKQS
ncbi:phosphoribosylamine--glycine ligase [Varunaivibrio sulfuroxidans]|uniref:Phosphoribosylamine--glycine ligase n=1 Tax=Varunaivibrio sulfuroxidans TaxID=1773489 RepID=A0A4R3J6Z4_9PROT|nr:phosphoribosylamine--glycine ligase [Varunaivibrio sulfuroxidans]TCS60636.1 phosphoribosylamine--glycine ligase [Varunaivibrio sulfuroxidans]WES30125.1 phosphoribosylamine--glycine ligase [Varunaivibrio sulfuroxidans]